MKKIHHILTEREFNEKTQEAGGDEYICIRIGGDGDIHPASEEVNTFDGRSDDPTEPALITWVEGNETSAYEMYLEAIDEANRAREGGLA